MMPVKPLETPIVRDEAVKDLGIYHDLRLITRSAPKIEYRGFFSATFNGREGWSLSSHSTLPERQNQYVCRKQNPPVSAAMGRNVENRLNDSSLSNSRGCVPHFG
jgi:hypothetical protein